MKKIILSGFAAVLTFTPAVIVPVEATYFSSVNDCHLNKKSDESILINYFETKIVSHNGRTSYTKSGIHIPKGIYDVYLEGSDGYNGRSNIDQYEEKYAVKFYSYGKEVAVSNATQDVPDSQDGAFWNGKVNSDFQIGNDIDSLQIFHAGSTDSLNSISPTCILLVPQGKIEPVSHPAPQPATKKHPAAPICGNGTIENNEQCDDGNTTAGDGCGTMCSLERVIVDPVCGNAIAEPGEQCDDGNTDDINCNAQCKIPVMNLGPTPQSVEEKRCSSEIGNTVFNDLNNNGTHDEGEPGIDDVKVKLQYGDNVDTDKTNFRGRYGFDDLCKDTYRVIVATETLPQGCFQTYDRDGTLDHTFKKKLGENDDYTKSDFGYHCPDGKVSPQTGPGAAAAAAAAVIASATAMLGIRKTKKDSGTIIPID